MYVQKLGMCRRARFLEEIYSHQHYSFTDCNALIYGKTPHSLSPQRIENHVKFKTSYSTMDEFNKRTVETNVTLTYALTITASTMFCLTLNRTVIAIVHKYMSGKSTACKIASKRNPCYLGLVWKENPSEPVQMAGKSLCEIHDTVHHVPSWSIMDEQCSRLIVNSVDCPCRLSDVSGSASRSSKFGFDHRN